ncbi:MAG: hypothetical protein HOV73_25930 [Streptomyces sp.]|nr:hypothetical protein [Streptomyces sp.]
MDAILFILTGLCLLGCCWAALDTHRYAGRAERAARRAVHAAARAEAAAAAARAMHGEERS